jgi:hypothetical protein
MGRVGRGAAGAAGVALAYRLESAACKGWLVLLLPAVAAFTVSTRVAKPQSPEEAAPVAFLAAWAAHRAAREGVVMQASAPLGETQLTGAGRPPRETERVELLVTPKGAPGGATRSTVVVPERVETKGLREGGRAAMAVAAAATAASAAVSAEGQAASAVEFHGKKEEGVALEGLLALLLLLLLVQSGRKRGRRRTAPGKGRGSAPRLRNSPGTPLISASRRASGGMEEGRAVKGRVRVGEVAG